MSVSEGRQETGRMEQGRACSGRGESEMSGEKLEGLSVLHAEWGASRAAVTCERCCGHGHLGVKVLRGLIVRWRELLPPHQEGGA